MTFPAETTSLEVIPDEIHTTAVATTNQLTDRLDCYHLTTIKYKMLLLVRLTFQKTFATRSANMMQTQVSKVVESANGQKPLWEAREKWLKACVINQSSFLAPNFPPPPAALAARFFCISS